MDDNAQRRLTDQLLPAVLAAAQLEMAYFRAGRSVAADIVLKADASPVTVADQRAEALIVAVLGTIAPAVTVIAEEAYAAGARHARSEPFFLVDALDGTKNFVAGEPEFTINIGLISNGVPIYGLIYAPAMGSLFVTDGPSRALTAEIPCNAAPLHLDAWKPARLAVRSPPSEGLTVLLSRSRSHDLTDPVFADLKVHERRHIGSSYKFCIVAQGHADLYIQQGGTCEWDTAAGDALVRAAGGVVLTMAGLPLVYGGFDREFRNPPFIASSGPWSSMRSNTR
jgi:3'(2'), 5'-bisphosphate nucleotidase